MCNIGIVLGDAGVKLPTAILFMNSNKSERNIRKKVAKAREKCMSQGIVLGHDVVINKGPDRDIDRDGRIIENMGKVDKDTLARITEAVQVQVGVFDKYN